MTNKKIAFLLPGINFEPCGGYKIVYEYANRFVKEGYEVKLVYPYMEDIFNKSNRNIFQVAKKLLGFFYKCKIKHAVASSWFKLSDEIKPVFCFKLNNFCLKKSLKDFKIVASAVETAYALNKITFVEDKNKFYFIQDFEQWNGKSKEDIYNSYKFPLTKIVIAPWLEEQVKIGGGYGPTSA